jgi:hypothetical protein
MFGDNLLARVAFSQGFACKCQTLLSDAAEHSRGTCPGALEEHDNERLDTRAPGTASGANQGLATVETIDRAKVRRGEGACVAKRA